MVDALAGVAARGSRPFFGTCGQAAKAPPPEPAPRDVVAGRRPGLLPRCFVSPASLAHHSALTHTPSPNTGPSFAKPRHLILHNDSTGCTQTPAAGAAALTPADLARPRANTPLEEAIAVGTMLLFFR